MSVNKFFNHFYNGTIPEGSKDRYFGQDFLREFWFLINSSGMMVDDITGQIPLLASNSLVSQGSGSNLDISAGFGYAEYQVELPDDWSLSPPPKTTANVEAIGIVWPSQNDLNLLSPNCSIYSIVDDGSTVHYVKVRFDHADLNQRGKIKSSGTYYYEQEPSFDFQVNSTAPTSQDLCLATFTSSGGVYTFSEYNNNKIKYNTIKKTSESLKDSNDIFPGIYVSIWTERSNPKNNILYSVAWSPSLNLLCAVGHIDVTDAYMVTSPGGVHWTERSNPKNTNTKEIVWSPSLSLFCAVGQADGTDAYILTSPNGTTWTERSNPKNASLEGVAWSPSLSLFCAVGGADGTDAYILTSPNGTTWTERSNPKNIVLHSITWSPDLSLFCAVGYADGSDAYIVTSSNGTTWTERSNPKNFDLYNVGWSPSLSLFCAVGKADGTDAYIVTSPDGTTWTERSNPKNYTLLGVDWSPEFEIFCAVGGVSGSSNYTIISYDGVNWEERNINKNYYFRKVKWISDLNIFIIVGEGDGIDANIFTSLLN